ncbi:MAG: nucleoside-diphosphate kinase [Paenibacillaceae bacterium]|nr:nucleoside-diphosphate kinase [Paenibacillaceae bacterium]
MTQKTFVMVKPDGVKRKLIGEVVSRFERKGLTLVAAKFLWLTDPQAQAHYAEHAEKPFFAELVEMITSGPVLAMVWEGDDAIALARLLIGKTAHLDAAPGTIRGDFATSTRSNIVHGADGIASAQREIALFFPEQAQRYDA